MLLSLDELADGNERNQATGRAFEPGPESDRSHGLGDFSRVWNPDVQGQGRPVETVSSRGLGHP